jgi:hypothetical protein
MFDETAVADQPTTETAEVVETTETAQESSAETATEETQLSEAQATEESQDADWLPDEQLKVFPDEAYVTYAQKRYPELVKLLNDENLPEPTRLQVKQVLHDKINSDIEIRRKAQAEESEQEEETTEEPTQQVDPVKAQAEWEQRATSFVDQVSDPEADIKWMGELEKAAQIKDPRQRSIQQTKVLKVGVINLLRDALPAFLAGDQGMLRQYLESQYEGLGDTVKQTSWSRAWNELKSENPNLPAYDPDPKSPWSQAIAKVADMVPGFEHFAIPGATPLQNFTAKAKIAAKLLKQGAGPNAVAEATKAVEKGKQIAKESERNKNLGKLGAGQSKGQLAKPSGNDPLKESLAAHKAESNPFAALQVQK